jgi:hypothetical protein
MLVLVGLLMYRTRDPAVWKWLAPGEDKRPAAGREVSAKALGVQAHAGAATTPQPAPEAPGNPPDAGRGRLAKSQPTQGSPAKPQPVPGAPAKPEAGGPTDEDPDEWDEMVHNDALVIDDGTLKISKAEQFAYSRVLMWVNNQSLARLRERVRKENNDLPFDRLVSDPAEMRFEIVEVSLNVRQVEDYGVEGPGGGELYEIQGFNRQNMLFLGVVEGLPEGMPSGAQIQEQVRLVGYFFKLQGYYPSWKTKGPPLRAPVIVGKLVWLPSQAAPRDTTPGWVWVALAMGAIVVVSGGVFLKSVLVGGLFRRPPRVRLPSLGPNPDAPAVDEWLDMAQSGDVGPGNNISGNGESRSGHTHPGPEDADDGPPPLFPGGFGSIG